MRPIRSTSPSRRALALVLPLLGGASAVAADHVVSPGQSIQAAIQAAANGDRVLVQPGVYPEAIDFLGRAIEVIGVGGAAVTTIDASGLGASVVRFANGEPPSARLRGFTLTGGTGSVAGGGQAGGGGILAANGAAPTIRACRIVGNGLAGVGWVGAGVLAAWLGGPAARITLEDSVIADNAGRGAVGALTLRRCSVLRNADGGVAGRGSFLLRECLIAGNTTPGDGGGFVLLGPPALFGQSFESCVFLENHADGRGGAYFAGGEPFGGALGLFVSGCAFVGNRAGEDGGAVYVDAVVDGAFPAAVHVERCMFANNQAGGAGGAAWLRAFHPTKDSGIGFVHCTFSGNSSGIVTDTEITTVRDSILWNQPAPISVTNLLTVTRSNVQGGFPGVGNFSVDPFFVDAASGDLRLTAPSPCVDLIETEPIAAGDFEGDPPTGPFADVGADEFHPHLKVHGMPAPGSVVTLSVVGPSGAPATVLLAGLSLASAPTPTPYGDLWLADLVPSLAIVLPPLSPFGHLGAQVPLAPALPPATLHLQAFVATGPTSGVATNVASLRIE